VHNSIFLQKDITAATSLYQWSGGVSINKAEKLKYLGITIKSVLSWKTHIQNVCGKELKNLGSIRRIVGRSSNEKVKERCYFALVRPHIEYAASIWDPEQKDLIKELDKIHIKAAHFVKNCYGRTESVSKLLEDLSGNHYRLGGCAQDIVC
jgi:hypothetical protein